MNINRNFDKYIKAWDSRRINRHEAAMAKMYEQISRKRRRGEVIDATRTVSDVTEDETVFDGSERREYIGDDE